MVKAPTPGQGPSAKAQEEESKRVALRISVGKGKDLKEYTLHFDDLGPQDDLVSRKQTGLPVTPFFEDERFGSDSLLILYWMARRHAGEPGLRYAEIAEKYTSYKAVADAGFQIEELSEEEEGGQDGSPLVSDES